MLRTLALAFLVAIAAPAAHAQSPGARTTRVLLQLEDDWGKALIRRDAAAFRRLLTDRFVYTENERVMTKDELIREVVSGSDTVTSAKNEGLKTYLYGSAAIVTGVLALEGRGKDGPFRRRFQFTDTWVFQNGRWQVAAAQDYLLPQ